MTGTFHNTFNIGNIKSNSEYAPAGIGGYIFSNYEFNNARFLNNVSLAITRFSWATVYTTSVLEPSTKEYMQSQEFVDELNTYVNNYNEEHKNDEDFISLNRWKYNIGNYPTYE